MGTEELAGAEEERLMGTPACWQICWTTLFTTGTEASVTALNALGITKLTGLVGQAAGLSYARLDLRNELGFGAVAGEVGGGGAVVSGQGRGEALEL